MVSNNNHKHIFTNISFLFSQSVFPRQDFDQ